MAWRNTQSIGSRKYTCGYCHNRVAVDSGYGNLSEGTDIRICSHCDNPTFFSNKDGQIPGVLQGITVKNLPDDVKNLYNEARRCMAVSAYTSVVMLCRKLLMHIAVEKGAEKNKKFYVYVNWLDENNYIPPDGKGWVNYIRDKGNDANHEIQLMNHQDAEKLMAFIGMLMKIVYEFPSMLPQPENEG